MSSNYKYNDIPTASAVTAVSSPYDDDGSKGYGNYGSTAAATTFSDDGKPVVGGEAQPPAFRDWWAGLLFYVQLVAVVVMSVGYFNGSIEVDWDGDNILDDDDDNTYKGTGSGRWLKTAMKQSSTGEIDDASCLSSNGTNDGTFYWSGSILLFVMPFLVAPVLTVVMFSYMYRNASQLIQMSIYLSIGLNLIVALLCLVSGLYPAVLAPALGVFLTYLYARYVWHRIPYAGKECIL